MFPIANPKPSGISEVKAKITTSATGFDATAIIRPRRRRNGGAESAVRPLVILLVGRRRRFCVARLAVASAKPDAAEAVKAHGPAAALIKGEERGEEGSGEQEEGKEGEAGGKAEVGDAWEVHRGRDEESDEIG